MHIKSKWNVGRGKWETLAFCELLEKILSNVKNTDETLGM
jgi:hypothetical protein